MHFAKQTVASILKKQDDIKYEPRKKMPLSPDRSQLNENMYMTHGTPRQRDERMVSLKNVVML